MTIAAIIAILIGINALYVAAEFAAVSVRTSRIQQQAAKGGGLAKRLLPHLKDGHSLDRYIAACQIGITLSSLILGAYGQATLARALAPHFERLGAMQAVTAQSTSALVVLVGLTIVQMVLGELVPKSLALQFPTRLALWTVIPMQWSLRLFSWFIRVLNGSGALILRMVGFESAGHRHIHSPEELEYLIAESRAGGLLEPAEHRRLRRALRLGTLRLDEFLVPRVRIAALDIDAPPEEALATILASPFTRLPVYRESIDEIVGLVHAKDVARLAARQPEALDLRAVVRPVLVVPASLTADQLLVRMREEKRQFAIVLDEFGGTAGIVSIEDVLEQVIGEIVDEFKPPDAAPERLADGRVRLPGDLHVDEVETVLGTPWDDEEAHTVGGRVVAAFGRIPSPGERIVIDGVLVEVELVAHHAITSVIVTVPDRRDRSRPGPGPAEGAA